MNFRMGSKWYSDVLKNVAEEERQLLQLQHRRGQKSSWSSSCPQTPPAPCTWVRRGGVLGDALASVLSRRLRRRREFCSQRFRQPDRKVCKQHRGAQHPASQGRGRDRVPRGRLSTATISRSLQSSSAKSMATTGSSSDTPERHKMMAEFGLSINLPKMKRDLARYGIEYDQWFLESSLHASGYVADSGAEAHRRRLYI